MKNREPWNFCETPKEKCTMNYCDENGCQNRKRNYVEDNDFIVDVSHRAINVNFGNPESIKVPENWKDAKGINASHKETNSAFAERDYKCECETGSEPLAVVEGYHIWWCKSHHQPLYKCDRERVISPKI